LMHEVQNLIQSQDGHWAKKIAAEGWDTFNATRTFVSEATLSIEFNGSCSRKLLVLLFWMVGCLLKVKNSLQQRFNWRLFSRIFQYSFQDLFSQKVVFRNFLKVVENSCLEKICSKLLSMYFQTSYKKFFFVSKEHCWFPKLFVVAFAVGYGTGLSKNAQNIIQHKNKNII
jgi:hypothetical protein